MKKLINLVEDIFSEHHAACLAYGRIVRIVSNPDKPDLLIVVKVKRMQFRFFVSEDLESDSLQVGDKVYVIGHFVGKGDFIHADWIAISDSY